MPARHFLLYGLLILWSLQYEKTMAQNRVEQDNFLSFESKSELLAYFRYTSDSSIIVSGHRGGKLKGYPENSIASFQYVLSRIPVFFETDPRLTKDSIIVLMHDETLDRTTTARGKLVDYTYEDLDSVRLKDHLGNVTTYKIPTLEEAICWSKGKTILNLDKKDVPAQHIVDLIKKHNASNHILLTVHTGAQARYYYDRLPDIMMSAFVRNEKEYVDMAVSGVPWENIIAYVGQTIDDSNQEIVRKLHGHGVKCMVSFAPTHDRLKTEEERESAYKGEITRRPDIIESDLPIEVFEVLRKK